MLDELAKKDSKWREIALNICKSKDLADEITNQMYLRIYTYNPPKEKLTDYYIIGTIKNLFLDHCKRRKHISIESCHYLEDYTEDKTFTDEEIRLLDKANELRWSERELLTQSYDKSLRQIEKEFNIHYGYTYRTNIKSKKFILGEDYEPYKSKRLKHIKNYGKAS